MAINVMYQVPNSLIQQQRQAENRAYRRQMNLLQMQQNFQQSQAEANRQFQREQATTEYERQMERLATQQNFQMRQVASQREYEQSMMQNKMSAQMEFNRQQHLQDLEFRRQENEMNRDFQRERMEMQEQFMDKRAERQYSREDTVYSRNRRDKQEDVANERDWREKQQAEQRMYELRKMAQAAQIGEEARRQKMLDEASMLQYSMLNTHDFSDEQMSERTRLQQEIHDISEASLKGEITKQQGDDAIWKRRIQLETMTPSKLKNPQTQMNLKEQFEQESFVDENGVTWTRNPKGGWDATMPPKAASGDDKKAKDMELKRKKAEKAWEASGGDPKRATKIYQEQEEFEKKVLGNELGAKPVGSYF